MLLLSQDHFFPFKKFRAYLDFYFLKLRSHSEQKHFLENFKDQDILNVINSFTSLFIENPFYSTPILLISEKDSDISLITKWQRSFYISIYREYKDGEKNKKVDELIDRLLSINRSFQYLVSLEKDENYDKLLFYLSSHSYQKK